MKVRRAHAASNPLALSLTKVAAKNHDGAPAATSEKNRIGSVAAISSHQCRGCVTRSAHSNTESGNQNGDAAGLAERHAVGVGNVVGGDKREEAKELVHVGMASEQLINAVENYAVRGVTTVGPGQTGSPRGCNSR